MRFAFIVLAAALLASCAREPRVMSSTVDAVTVRYFEGEQDAAEATARDECARYNRRARLRNVNSEGTGERMAIFDCLPS